MNCAASILEANSVVYLEDLCYVIVDTQENILVKNKTDWIFSYAKSQCRYVCVKLLLLLLLLLLCDCGYYSLVGVVELTLTGTRIPVQYMCVCVCVCVCVFLCVYVCICACLEVSVERWRKRRVYLFDESLYLCLLPFFLTFLIPRLLFLVWPRKWKRRVACSWRQELEKSKTFKMETMRQLHR